MTFGTVQPSSSSPTYSTAPATVLQRIVEGTTKLSEPQELRLLFLGCESQPPYGPYEHTATLFLDLITRALETMGAPTYHVTIDVYHVSKQHFPPRSAVAEYQGVILPGSFNSAYDSEPWIKELSTLIQEELVAKQRPTLGICFGHQLYAHSFPDGGAIKCPSGPQAGRKVSQLTSMGQQWLHGEILGTENLPTRTSALQLYYTHGDMVEKLPSQGHCLGGTKEVPIQAAIYLSSTDQKPIAITFQAHPEYASSKSLGLQGTLNPIMKAMNDRQDISDQELQHAAEDASLEFDAVEAHSIRTMITAGRLLGWFPTEDKQNSM